MGENHNQSLIAKNEISAERNLLKVIVEEVPTFELPCEEIPVPNPPSLAGKNKLNSYF